MTLQRAALWAIVIAATMYLLVAGRGLLLPAVLGVVLWYMVDALADVIERPRLASSSCHGRIALLAAICTMGACSGSSVGPSRATSAPVAAAAPTYEIRLQRLIDQGAHCWGSRTRRRSTSSSTASASPIRLAAWPRPRPPS